MNLEMNLEKIKVLLFGLEKKKLSQDIHFIRFFEIQTYEGIKTNQWCFPECAESEQDT